MQFRAIPVIFYTTALITLLCQLVALDALPLPGGEGAAPAEVKVVENPPPTATDPVFWDADGCTLCYELESGQELSADHLHTMVDGWSQYSRTKLASLLLNWEPEDERLRLMIKYSSQPDDLRFMQLTAQDIREVLSVLHPRS